MCSGGERLQVHCNRHSQPWAALWTLSPPPARSAHLHVGWPRRVRRVQRVRRETAGSLATKDDAATEGEMASNAEGRRRLQAVERRGRQGRDVVVVMNDPSEESPVYEGRYMRALQVQEVAGDRQCTGDVLLRLAAVSRYAAARVHSRAPGLQGSMSKHLAASGQRASERRTLSHT